MEEAVRDEKDADTVAMAAVAVGQDEAVEMVAKPTLAANGKATTKRWPSFHLVWNCISSKFLPSSCHTFLLDKVRKVTPGPDQGRRRLCSLRHDCFFSRSQ